MLIKSISKSAKKKKTKNVKIRSKLRIELKLERAPLPVLSVKKTTLSKLPEFKRTVPIKQQITKQETNDKAFRQMPLEAIARKKISVDSLHLPKKSFQLFPYQLTGICSIAAFNYRCLLADDMGLGKTIQSIVSFVTCNKYPVLIVCPASVKVNWKMEIIKAYGKKFDICVVSGKSGSIVDDADIYIVNYDIINSHAEFFDDLGIQFLILDECHMIKNVSLRTKACMQIGKNVPRIVAISGTPILNRPIELYNVLKLLLPKIIRNKDAFGMRYSNRVVSKFGVRYEGSKNSDELNKLLLSNCMVRRFKKDVLHELPKKIHSSVYCELSNMEEYNECSDDIMSWIGKTQGAKAIKKAMRAEYLVKMSKLRGLIALGKMEAACAYIDSYLESGKKLVVFAIHKVLIDALMKRYGKLAVKIDGSVSSGKRQDIVDKFQNDKQHKLFIGNIRAAGVGITLTAADTVLFLEIGHTPAEHEQAEDRIYRIGQTAKSVQVVYMIAENTVEQRQLSLIDKKRRLITGILNKKKSPSSDTGNMNLIDFQNLFDI